MVHKTILGGALVAVGAGSAFLIARELFNKGCPRINSDNVIEIASMIIDGSFPGIVPDFFRDFTTQEFLNNQISAQVYIDAYKFLVREEVIVCR